MAAVEARSVEGDSRLHAQGSRDEIMRSASLETRIPYYSLKGQLCDSQGCLTRVGEKLPDELIVFDDGHLTASGATYLVRSGLGQRIDSLLAGEE